ncbi:MAG: DUF5009 domain-containing protein [Bacteroides sp.]|nr:DUF5009 domain-containing protein [Bacteroides sp.]MCM1379040.1 DUF5009 domain-containing protein [Bacteroides sp.]MCM1445656.1 DUF5009 domain-containing protein [Prevotella sp.]
MKERLESLDILRGLDMFLLVFLQPVVIAIGYAGQWPWFDGVMHQLDHEVWEGFRVWDMIMPLFLFMVGTAMPFSFAKYTHPGADRRKLWIRILRRFLLLFVAGAIVQGNLLALNPALLKFYTNTLQAIACGYLIASVILLNFGPRGQLVATALLLIIYTVPMHLFGDFSVRGNFAYKVDLAILGDRRGDPTYTWIWSSLTFGVTVMLGAFAGQIMRSRPRTGRTVAILAGIGVALIVSALIWSTWMPIIKRIWSASMTLFSGGICFLLMAMSYYLVDCLGWHSGLDWLKIYGTNAITAYLLGEVVNFRSIVSSLTYGLAQWFGPFYGAWLTFGNFLIVFLILRYMYRHKIFLKI